MSGKVISITLLFLLVAASAIGAASIATISGVDGGFQLAGTVSVISVGIVAILNMVGLWFGRRSFGVAGLLISLGILIYGIYVAATNKGSPTSNPYWTQVTAGTSISVGAVSTLTSLGVITNM